jgi:hypothetical protein
MRLIAILVVLVMLVSVGYGQDLVKGIQKGGPVQLSGLSKDIFDGAFFASEGWTFDTTSYSLTPSMAAFLGGNDAKDGAPYGNKTPLRCGSA